MSTGGVVDSLKAELDAARERHLAALSPMDRFIYKAQEEFYRDMLLYGHATVGKQHWTQTRDALVVADADTCRHCKGAE